MTRKEFIAQAKEKLAAQKATAQTEDAEETMENTAETEEE